MGGGGGWGGGGGVGRVGEVLFGLGWGKLMRRLGVKAIMAAVRRPAVRYGVERAHWSLVPDNSGFYFCKVGVDLRKTRRRSTLPGT